MICDRCCKTPFVKRMPAVHWCFKTSRSTRTHGNRLCRACLSHLKKDVGTFAPRPGYSKPAVFIVAQTKTKTVGGERAITLCICFGNWMRASEIKSSALLTKTRYFVSDLKKCAQPTHAIMEDKSHSNVPELSISDIEEALQQIRTEEMVEEHAKVQAKKQQDKQLLKQSDGKQKPSYECRNGYGFCLMCEEWFARTAAGNIRRHSCVAN